MTTVAQKHAPIIKLIAHSIEKDEQGIKNLLKKNGVNADVIKTKRELSKVFVQALSKSKPLAIDFGRYIESKKSMPTTFNADGREVLEPLDISNLGQSGTYNQIQTTSIPKTTTTTPPSLSTLTYQPTGFFSGINLKDLLNTGVKAMELQKDIQVSKDNASAVEMAVQAKRDEMNLAPTKKGTSTTGIYILVSVIGLAIVGTIAYVALKKK